MPSVLPPLQDAVATHARRRAVEAALRLAGGVLVAGMLARALEPRATGVGIGAAMLVAGGVAWWARHRWLRQVRTRSIVAQLVDTAGQTADLVRTAYFIETGRSRGADALGTAIVEEAAEVLPGLLPAVDAPVRLPRMLPVALALAALLWFVPAPSVQTVAPTPGAVVVTPGDPDAALPAASPDDAPAELDEASLAARVSEDGSKSSGADQRSSGGAESTDAEGISGQSGDRAADGAADATEATGEASTGAGASEGTAREAGTSGVAGTEAGSGADRAPGELGPGAKAPPEEGSTETDAADGNTTGMVDQTAAVQDAVRSTADTIELQEGTPDDQDAQTRSVAGTLDLSSDRPQFFDATEESDDEQDGKGGAGGWTIGLSQPGEGGVNDASGSTFRTEAGIEDPPDWTDAPSEWVDAAWQDSPAGIIRRVNDGQVSGSGSTNYAAAWHRYAAVAEADTTRPAVSPGRSALIRQYFLAIAPSETP